MVRDAALAANVAWLVVVLAYLFTAGNLEGGSLFIFVLVGIGLPILNILALFRSNAARRWD